MNEIIKRELMDWLWNSGSLDKVPVTDVTFDSANDIRLLTDKMFNIKTGFEGNMFFDFIGWYQQEYARAAGFAYAWMLFTRIKEFQQACEIHEFLKISKAITEVTE